MKKGNKGFTLIEMIVIIAILATLAAIAIPSFFAAISRAEEAACATNRRSAETFLQARIILNEIEVSESELDAELHKMGITCPAHGSLHVKYSEEKQRVYVECTEHTETITQRVLREFTEMCKNFKDYSSYENSSIIRDAMYELLGTWNSIGFIGDTKEYYIQPYWNVESKEMYVFAGNDNAPEGSWYTGYIYDAKTATWYHGKSFSFVKNDDIHNWNDVWEKMQDYGWKPVEVEYEK